MRNNIYTNASQIYTLTEIREGVIRLCGKAEKMCSLAKFQFNFSVYAFLCFLVWVKIRKCEKKKQSVRLREVKTRGTPNIPQHQLLWNFSYVPSVLVHLDKIILRANRFRSLSEKESMEQG